MALAHDHDRLDTVIFKRQKSLLRGFGKELGMLLYCFTLLNVV